MARVMERVVGVKTKTEKLNCYATIIRSMIAATTASLRLNDKKSAKTFGKMKDWASDRYNEVLVEAMEEDEETAKK